MQTEISVFLLIQFWRIHFDSGLGYSNFFKSNHLILGLVSVLRHLVNECDIWRIYGSTNNMTSGECMKVRRIRHLANTKNTTSGECMKVRRIRHLANIWRCDKCGIWRIHGRKKNTTSSGEWKQGESDQCLDTNASKHIRSIAPSREKGLDWGNPNCMNALINKLKDILTLTLTDPMMEIYVALNPIENTNRIMDYSILINHVWNKMFKW